MEKINFINGKAPAINAVNLNQMQTNAENAINELAAPKIKKLWENPDHFVAFDAQDITLSSDDYDYLIVTYKLYRTNSDLSGQHLSQFMPKGLGFKLIDVGSIGVGSNWANCCGFSRGANFISNTKFAIAGCNASVSIEPYVLENINDYLIPLAIYGGKF